MSLGFCFYAWNADPNAYHAIRNELGRKIEGTRADFPYIVQPMVRPFGNYYIDFKVRAHTHTDRLAIRICTPQQTREV